MAEDLSLVAQLIIDRTKALVAIQELHKPVAPVFNWKTGLTHYPPCPDCNGKAGVHDCGCWADKDVEYECSYCNDFDNPRRTQVLWPCDTRKLVDEALGGGERA